MHGYSDTVDHGGKMQRKIGTAHLLWSTHCLNALKLKSASPLMQRDSARFLGA